jgi:uncharacterized protein YabN with tetrapyrrole methylase and pyrophosphatase domain
VTARRLLAPGGCPWDRAQTVSSLLPYLAEETWEVFESARARRRGALQDELGDVLYTVLFLALLAERRGWFTPQQMLESTTRKMIRRHPHVFGPRPARSPAQAYRRWQRVKRGEGAPASRSKRLRPLLVGWWELLRRHPQAMAAAGRTLTGLRQRLEAASGRPKRPSGRRGRTSAR